jgi:hypothetical protein
LKWRIPKIFSFMQYIDAYAKVLIDKSLVQLPENVLVGHTHLVNHMDSLAFFLRTKTPSTSEESLVGLDAASTSPG